MEINPVIIGGAFGAVNVGVGIWLKVLHDAIKSKVTQKEYDGTVANLKALNDVVKYKVGQKEHDGTTARLERAINKKVDHAHCELKEQLALEKFHNIEQLIDLGNSVNASDHDELKTGVSSVEKDMKETTKALSQINKCLALLSERISRKNTTDEEDE